MTGTVCPHCEKPIAPSAFARHVRICVHSPEVCERLLAFLHETARDGRILTETAYRRASSRLGLPHAVTLRQHFGTWPRLAAWAGLQTIKTEYSTRNKAGMAALSAPTDPIGPNPEQEEEFRMFEGMRARPGVMVRPAWDIRTKRYVPAYVETGWCRLW